MERTRRRASPQSDHRAVRAGRRSLHPSHEVHGHTELEERIATAYEQWVKPGIHVFRAVPNANGHHNAVRFNWEMVIRASGAVDSVGFDFIVLNGEGLIKSDHQFID
ncbi:hypothetical protein ACFQX6_07005 [Streptosporangium lutulentum]